MRILIFIVSLLLATNLHSQEVDYFYARSGFDVNNAIGFIDSGGDFDALGFDADYEIGYRSGNMGYYGLYSSFSARDLEAYSGGVDYYFDFLDGLTWKSGDTMLVKGFEFSVGGNVGASIRKSNEVDFAYSARSILTANVLDNVGVYVEAKLDRVPDIEEFQFGVLFGFRYRFLNDPLGG